LEETPDGLVRLSLSRPWTDGTGMLVFSPLELVQRLAAIGPPPGNHTVVYHGVIAAHSALRARILPRAPEPAPQRVLRRTRDPPIKIVGYTWATLLARAFFADGFLCPPCGQQMFLRTVVIGVPATTEILDDLRAAAARDPPIAA
jgi:hypothetical protein